MSTEITKASYEINLKQRLQKIEGALKLFNAIPKSDAGLAKYAQPCIEGVYMGIVNVRLKNTNNGVVSIAGDGRLHQMSMSGAKDAWWDSKPKVCKYHKLSPTDRPDNVPKVIALEFEFFIYKEREYYNENFVQENYDVEMKKQINYTTIKCTIELFQVHCIDREADGYFYDYAFNNVSTKDSIDETTKDIITSLAQSNKYTFEFQILNAHPKMPGLYFASSVGYPSDRLAVLFGGRTLVKRNNIETGRNGLVELSKSRDFNYIFFAQYKFDNGKWHTLKIIHAVMANVLSKMEYMYNYLLDMPDLNGATIELTKFFCQGVLDYITNAYIDTVLENIELLKSPEGTQIKISKIREVCEYVFLMKYPFLLTSHWKVVGGIYELSDNFKLDMQSDSNIGNVRAIAYKVVSSIIEPYRASIAAENQIAEPEKVNVFSAYDVFMAYVDCRYRDEAGNCPPEFTAVLEDAKQLALNMKYLKTSSNFAVVRLKESCELAVARDPGFRWASTCMLAASKKIISLLVQRNPETLHEKFSEFVLSTSHALRDNELSSRTNVHSIDDGDIDTFEFKDNMSRTKNEITMDELQYLVLATQLHALTAMRRAEREQKWSVESFASKNYFKYSGVQHDPTKATARLLDVNPRKFPVELNKFTSERKNASDRRY